MEGHLLKYKNDKGEWVALPFAVINVYDIYCAYCSKQNITPVKESTYFETLGNLESLVSTLQDEAGTIGSLIEALGGGYLPLSKGGLNQSFDNETELGTYLKNLLTKYSALGENDHLATVLDLEDLNESLTQSIEVKLDESKISMGPDKPGETTTGDYYFQYDAVNV